MTLLVRDEEDILDAHLDYHLSAGVDLIIVTDHRSTDRTPAILERYRVKHGVHVLREEGEAYDQTAWVTRMARRAYELRARWVINADADEFWWPTSGDLRSVLEAVPAQYDVVSVQRRDLPPVARTDGSAFWESMVYREVTSFNLLGQPLPSKVCHRAMPDVTVAQGNHSVSADGLRATLADGRIEVLHFPMRTYAQFERKIVSGGQAYEAPGAPPGVGGTWRHAYGLWRAGKLRELFDERALDASRLAQRLASGEVVVDTRLRDRLRLLRS